MKTTIALLATVGLLWALSDCGASQTPSPSSPNASASAHPERSVEDDIEGRLR